MGGTIDSEPYPDEENLYPADATVPAGSRAQELANLLVMESPCPMELYLETISICAKDSKAIDEEDKRLLEKNIRRASEMPTPPVRVLVTVGTDCMQEIALDMKARLPDIICPVIFTGAIWPISNGLKSDGPANLYDSFFASSRSVFLPDNYPPDIVPELEPDVYVCMNGLLAPAGEVYKDFSERRFKRSDQKNPEPLHYSFY